MTEFESFLESSPFNNALTVVLHRYWQKTDLKIRILCLHGYMQNATIFQSKLGSMRKVR